MGIEALLIAGGIALAGLIYKKWGKPFLKKHLDDPNTPQDESAVIDPFVEQAIETAIRAAAKEAVKEAAESGGARGILKADKLARDLSAKFGITQEDAIKRINKALGR